MAAKVVPNDFAAPIIQPPAIATTYQINNTSATDIFIDSYPGRLMAVAVGATPAVGIKVAAGTALALTAFGAPVYARAASYVIVEVVP